MTNLFLIINKDGGLVAENITVKDNKRGGVTYKAEMGKMDAKRLEGSSWINLSSVLTDNTMDSATARNYLARKFKMVAPLTEKEAKKQLEYLRQEIRAERISYGEISQLQALEAYIDEGDVELRSWLGLRD